MDHKSNINVTVENYFEMWNARDARTRRTPVEEVWTEQARSVDPIAEVVGCAKVPSDGRFIELVGFFDGGVPAAS